MPSNYPIVDLHCDLLLYLANGSARTPYDVQVGCGFPWLKKGGVKLQVMAHFAPTVKDSVQHGLSQSLAYQALLREHSDACYALTKEKFNTVLAEERLAVMWSIENASTFCDEEELLESAFSRLSDLITTQGKPLYLSLTWNMENRFGGGAHTDIGLKEDGKRLLEWLHIHQIALDFSHASDRLANDCLAFIDQQKWNLPVLASHSNFREITNVPRNLPNDLAKEILSRRGVIGLNVIRAFVGQSISHLPNHLAHALALGAHDHIALGADFFYEPDLAPDLRSTQEPYFFDSFTNASAYPSLLTLSQEALKFSDLFTRRWSSVNALAFIRRHFN